MQTVNQDHVTVNVADLVSSDGPSVIRVLHVDDDPSVLEVSKQILMTEGNFEVDQALCVDEALAKLQDGAYDCVISDYEMHPKNGLEFLAQLREDKNEIPFVLFTGRGREEVAIRALNLGADGYFNKQGSPETVYGELAHGIEMTVRRKSTERTLIEVQALTNSVFDSTKDLIWSVNADDFRLSTFNKALSDYYLKTENIHIKAGMTTRELMPSEQLAQKWLELSKRALKEGSFTVEYKTLKDPKVLELTFNVVKRGKEPFGISVFGKDITERKKAEEELVSAEQKFRTIFENVHDVITYVDTHGKILDVNSRVEDLLGYTREEIIGKNFTRLRLVNFRDVPKLLKLFIGTIRSGEALGIIELDLKHKNGDKVPVEVGTRFIRGKDGKIVGVVNIFRDITERKEAGEVLRESEERFFKTFNANPAAISISRLDDGLLVDVNETYLQLFECSRQEAIGHTSTELKIFANQNERAEILRLLKENGVVRNLEIPLLTKAGRLMKVLISIDKITVNSQDYMVSTVIDITERKKTEERLRLLNDLVASSDDAIIGESVDGVILSWNSGAQKIYGYAPEEVIGKRLSMLAPAGIQSEIPIILDKIKRGEKVEHCHSKRIKKDGSIMDVSATISPIRDEQGCTIGVSSITRDITERKKAEEELKLSSSIIDLATDLIFVHDLDGRFVYFNEATCKQRGYSEEEISKMSLHMLDAPESAKLVDLRIKELFNTGSAVFESVQLCKDKTRVPVEIHARLIDSNGKKLILSVVRDITERKNNEEALRKSEQRYKELANSLLETVFETDLNGNLTFFNDQSLKMTDFEAVKKNVNMMEFVIPEQRERVVENIKKSLSGNVHNPSEYTLKRRDGTTYPALVKTVPIVSENKVIGLRGTILDITEAKKAEEKLKESYRRMEIMTEKLRVVGSLTRHDVRNKLSAVAGYSYLLKKQYSDKPGIVDGLCKIEQSVKESGRIIDFAKMYEELGAEELVYVNVEEALDEAVALFSGSLPRIINKCDGLSVLADSFLRQLFYNLVDNTRKYGEKTTTISVYYENEGEDQLKLIYGDDGAGISAENKLRLFKEGFSTGGSTGFGLFLIKKMIEVYGWAIEETGEVGKGARFQITIPKHSPNGKENYQIAKKEP